MALQGLDSLRRFYTDDAGYALATQIDQDLFKLAALAQGGATTNAGVTWNQAVIGGDGSTAFIDTSPGNQSALSDAGLRQMIQTMDDNDVPMMGRVLIVPPVEKNNILGIARYTEQAFVGNGDSLTNGQIANLYGIKVFVTTNCPWVHVNSVTNTASTTFTSAVPTGTAFADTFANTVDWATGTPTDAKARIGMLLQKDAFALVEQQDIRSQVQYKQEYLSDLFTADTVYGTGELRDGSCVPFIVPA